MNQDQGKDLGRQISVDTIVSASGAQANIAGGDIHQTFIHQIATSTIKPVALFTMGKPPKDFVGREQELAALEHQFERGITIIGITGGAGIGKSALARMLAQRLANRFSEIQMEIDLRGVAQAESLSPVDAMRYLLGRLLGAVHLPDDENELASIYQDTFRKYKALILLDNAWDAAQIKRLLPPEPSMAIITSRANIVLAGAGLHPLPLDVLPLDQACQLLREATPRLADEMEEDLEELADRCGRLPMALKAAAGSLECWPDWSVEKYLDCLRDEHHRLQKLKGAGDPDLDVEAALYLSYNRLGENGQLRLRTLGVFPAPFDLKGLAAVWGVKEDNADADLRELLRLNLVEYRGYGVYKLHDLTRVFATTRLLEQSDEAHTVLVRHAEYYLDTCGEADSIYFKGNDNIPIALKQFAFAWPHLLVAWLRMSGNDPNWPSPVIAEHWLCDFTKRVGHLLELTIPAIQRISFRERALQAAQSIGDREREAANLGNLGRAYIILGETQRAIEYQHRALDIIGEIGDQKSFGGWMGSLGQAYFIFGETRRAIEYLQQAVEISRQFGDQRGEGAALGNLGNAYADLGEISYAIDCYHLGLSLARQIGDRRGEGARLDSLGNAYLELGETQRSIEYYQQAIDIARQINDRLGEGIRIGDLGNAHRKSGDTQLATEHYQQALDIARQIYDKKSEGTWLGNLGLVYADQGRPELAIEYIKQALYIAQKAGDRRNERRWAWCLGLQYEKVGDFANAANLMEIWVCWLEELSHPNAEKCRLQLESVKKQTSI